MSVVRFKHDVSLLITNGRLTFFSATGEHDYMILPEVFENSEAVQLDEGLVHIYTPMAVYQIQSGDLGFTVTKISAL